MKMQSLVTFFLLSIFIFNEDNSNKEYISLVYTGDQLKPYPVLVFYLPGYKGKEVEDFFVHKFEINEKQFEDIRKVTEEREDLLRDTTLASSYKLTFIYNGETTIFSTIFLDRLKKIFQTILDEFNDDFEKQGLIGHQFNSILIRLKYDNQW